MARINAVRQGAEAGAQGLPAGDALKGPLTDLSSKADVLRKEIVATKEGGAITGEERLREHTDQLYGAITSYEGAPAAYQLVHIEVLSRQLADISARFEQLAKTDLAARNRDLADRKLPRIDLPAAPANEPVGPGGAGPSPTLAGFAFSVHPQAVGTRAADAERD